MRVIAQRLGSPAIFQQVFISLLQDPYVVNSKALVAFVTLDGLLRIGAEPSGTLDNFILNTTKRLSWIVGIDAVTTSDALVCLRGLQDRSGGRCSIRAFSSSAGSLFHPKLFIFEKADGSGHVLIGSNNLTPGGLESNTEIAVLIEELTTDELLEWDRIWQQALVRREAIMDINDDLIHQVENERKRDLRRRRRVVVREEEETEPSYVGIRVLIRYIAKAGGRTSQVHFSLGKVRDFFHLIPGSTDEITLQMVQPGELLGRIETGRRLIFSNVNKNAKIEMEGLRDKIPDNYPADGRAILIVQEVESNHYRYMVLLPRNNGYNQLHNYLDSVSQQGLALKEDIMTIAQLLEIWPDYPI